MVVQLQLIIITILAAASVIATVMAHARFKKSWGSRKGTTKVGEYRSYATTWDKDDLPSFWVRGVGLFIAPVFVIALVVSLVPFNPSYWVLTEEGGTISSISNRFVEGTGDVSGVTYTLTLDGDPVPRVITDSRVLGLRVGDEIDLTCSLEWVYGGADKSNCYIRSF